MYRLWAVVVCCLLFCVDRCSVLCVVVCCWSLFDVLLSLMCDGFVLIVVCVLVGCVLCGVFCRFFCVGCWCWFIDVVCVPVVCFCMLSVFYYALRVVDWWLLLRLVAVSCFVFVGFSSFLC